MRSRVRIADLNLAVQFTQWPSAAAIVAEQVDGQRRDCRKAFQNSRTLIASASSDGRHERSRGDTSCALNDAMTSGFDGRSAPPGASEDDRLVPREWAADEIRLIQLHVVANSEPLLRQLG